LEHLSTTKLSEGCGQGSEQWTKLAIEKPFGRDLETAMQLDKKLAQIFEEKQIYRVDHYLAKETVQNMIAFRFANSIFEPVWNNKHIDHVQITFAEKREIGKRGRFFDGVGQLRDVAQNHLLQLLAAVAMEQPKSFARESVRDARAHAIKAIRRPSTDEIAESVVRGQYTGYLDEANVDPDSQTETFAAMKLYVDTQRFSGVPFYLRTGKAMAQDLVDIKIVFTQTCHLLFKEYGCPEIGNVLTIRIQPDEGIGIRFITKTPGNKLSLGTVDMKFSYAEQFTQRSMNAYEKLLLDILGGDQMLFNRSDELASSWHLISGILQGWENKESPLVTYEKGTWGPDEAVRLIEKDGRKWL
jgi:glucose-6-phosphate 1-dehydrogenase